MNKLFRSTVAALALGGAAAAQAATIGFDTNALIDIDNDSNVATYREAGFALSGPAASFLTIDGIGSAMSAGLYLSSGGTLSLVAEQGALFSFSGFDGASFDSMMAASLSVTGIFADSSQLSSTVQLAELGNFSFTGLSGLSELRISADSDVVLDNLMASTSPVPEPGSAAMLLLGIGALAGARKWSARRKAA